MYSFDEIKQRIADKLVDQQNTIQGTFTMDNIAAVSQELSRLYFMEILTIPDKVFIDTADGHNLDRIAFDHYITRNVATFASGIVEFSGKENTIIPINTKLSAGDIIFSTTQSVTIPSTLKAIAKVICDIPGSIGNVPTESINKVVAMYGINVKNLSPTEGGYDTESDDNLRSRIYEKIRKPYTSGNSNDYVRWARQVPGVGNAVCLPLWNGNGTVKVVLLGSDGNVPTDGVIQETTKYIESQRPIGALVTVVKADPKLVNIEANVSLNNGYKIEDVNTEFKKSLALYLVENPFESEAKCLSFYKISDLLFSLPAIADVVNYSLNGQTTSITAKREEFFKLNEVIINEIE